MSKCQQMYSTKFPASRGLFSLVLGGGRKRATHQIPGIRSLCQQGKYQIPKLILVELFRFSRLFLFVFCSPLHFAALHTIHHLNSAPCKGIRILESGKFLLVESRILGFAIRNTAQGIRNPTNKDQSPVHGIRNPQRAVQNPMTFLDSLTWGEFGTEYQTKFCEWCVDIQFHEV